MSYVDKNLLPQETVVYRTRLHWIVYVPAMLWVILALLAFAGSAKLQQWDTGKYVGAVLLLVGVLLAFIRWIQVASSEFAVTTKRVVIKVGLIRRHSVELLLRQVEGIGVEQGIMGRIFGYGSITVAGTGGTKEFFRQIAQPLEFRRQVQTLSA